MFLRRLTGETPPRTIWLATELAWHPGLELWSQPNSFDDLFRDARDPLLGKSMLGALRVDVGQFDLVESRGRIRPQERDLFYHVLSAVGHLKPSTLVRIANENLPIVKQHWQTHSEHKLRPLQKQLAREVVRRAEQGRYSAALLFNDPQPQIGRLFVFEGIARRAVRVEVSPESKDGGATVYYPYGFDHYYELEVFTDDSQNYPLVFCVRELPAGFPTGGELHVPVRVAGFFFKDWLYRTRGGGQGRDAAQTAGGGERAQYAPLLIGPAPIVLATPQDGAAGGRYVLGGLFLLALAGILATAVWFARDERRFRRRTPAAEFSLPPGQSLNELNLPVPEVPMTRKVESSAQHDS
jgi:hypothetical protein